MQEHLTMVQLQKPSSNGWEKHGPEWGEAERGKQLAGHLEFEETGQQKSVMVRMEKMDRF